MTITEAHYNFKLLYNKWDSQHKRDLNSAEIDELLNKAQDIWVEQTYSGFNSKQVGFENTQQRIDDISSLVIKCPSTKQSVLLPSNVNNHIYEFRLNELQHDYLHLIRAVVNAKTTDCENELEVHIVQHDDLSKILTDTYKKSSFLWKRAVGVFGYGSGTHATKGRNISLYIYGDSTFTIDSLCPEYIKRPVRVSIGGYSNISGNIKATVEFDLPPHVVHTVVDLAVREAQRIILDPEGFQLYSNLHDNDE